MQKIKVPVNMKVFIIENLWRYDQELHIQSNRLIQREDILNERVYLIIKDLFFNVVFHSVRARCW